MIQASLLDCSAQKCIVQLVLKFSNCCVEGRVYNFPNTCLTHIERVRTMSQQFQTVEKQLHDTKKHNKMLWSIWPAWTTTLVPDCFYSIVFNCLTYVLIIQRLVEIATHVFDNGCKQEKSKIQQQLLNRGNNCPHDPNKCKTIENMSQETMTLEPYIK